MFYYRRLYRLLPVVSALRRRHLAFFVCATATVAGEVSVSAPGADLVKTDDKRFVTMAEKEQTFKIEVSDGLMLYYDRFSFYSQKVVMVLHEKNLNFESKIINLIKSEQYQPWFLYLNPRGEVPVLQDTGKIIPDSARIIEYIEDNFSNGDTPRLIPMNPPIRQKVTHFRHILQKAPQAMLTTGAMIHQNMLKNPKTPFFGPIRKALANAEKNNGKTLREIAEKNPEYKEILMQKARESEEKYNILCQEKNFRDVLGQIHVILDEVEAELASHKGDQREWWLCSDRFTIADVELTVLLVRISQLGLDYAFWGSGHNPHIEDYFERVKQRESYKQTFPGTLVLLKTILITQAPLILGVVAAVALIITGAILAKKYA